MTVLILATSSTQASAKGTAFQIKETTWTFIEKGSKMRESIDADGNYIENSVAGKHVDHGTAVMKGNKACFTSAMTKDGEMCWTTRSVAIGQSMLTTNDKGRKLRVTRVKYVPMSLAK
jgi:hypothetical protein